MSNPEQKTAIMILGVVVLLTMVDLAEDIYTGTTLRHVWMEGIAMLAALAGMWYFWRRTLLDYKEQLRDSEERGEALRKSAEHWRQEAAQHLRGLGEAMDRQFGVWQLTESEKEVAMLLLKGLSQKEIADIRQVREKTIRQQCQAVYRKSELAGRAELSAFFLEDLLLPMNQPGALAETPPGHTGRGAPARKNTV